MENIGQKIANLRKEAELSQKELAKLIRRSGSYISRIESGEREPTPDFISAVLKVCREKNGWTEEEHRKQVKELQYTVLEVGGLGLAGRFLKHDYEIPELIQLIKKSRKVFFGGAAFTILIPLLEEEIEKSLKTGLEIRFLLLKPNSNALRMGVFSTNGAEGKNMPLTLKKNLTILEYLTKKESSGNLECRVIDYLLPYSIMAFDYHLPNGRMYVYLRAFRSSNISRPKFELIHSTDQVWFDYFVDQFETMWKESDEKVGNAHS